jgi:hypothetical protein
MQRNQDCKRDGAGVSRQARRTQGEPSQRTRADFDTPFRQLCRSVAAIESLLLRHRDPSSPFGAASLAIGM